VCPGSKERPTTRNPKISEAKVGSKKWRNYAG
jgi:hypothetical protein